MKFRIGHVYTASEPIIVSVIWFWQEINSVKVKQKGSGYCGISASNSRSNLEVIKRIIILPSWALIISYKHVLKLKIWNYWVKWTYFPIIFWRIFSLFSYVFSYLKKYLKLTITVLTALDNVLVILKVLFTRTLFVFNEIFHWILMTLVKSS